ncbi:MAG: hypothetical protein K2L30_09565 [Duncaniella sp.]|nr:hypothetical protein [Duncaniella sp.]
MNRIYHIATAAVMALTAFAASAGEPVDTVMSVSNPASVSITESPEGMRVTVSGIDGNSGYESSYFQGYPAGARVKARQETRWYPFSLAGNRPRRGKIHHWDLVTGGLGLGMVNAPGAPQAMGLEWEKSFEISWLHILAVRYTSRSLGVSAGIGVDWRNYKVTTDTRLQPNGQGGVTWGSYPADAQPRNSRLKVFSLQFPILYHQHLPFRISGFQPKIVVGPVLNWNSHASLRTKWRDAEGNDMEEYNSGVHQRRFTVDLFGALSLNGWANIYCRYSTQTILQGYGSPRFRSFSIGWMLFL